MKVRLSAVFVSTVFLGVVLVGGCGTVPVGDGGPAGGVADRAVKFIREWGTQGTGAGQFDVPYGIALDDAGNVYVTENNNPRVQKFGPGGSFRKQWGSSGTANGQFQQPQGIAVQSDGTVSVADWWRHDIQQFSRSGAFLRSFGGVGAGVVYPGQLAVHPTAQTLYVAEVVNHWVAKFYPHGPLLKQWGTSGTGAGQFNSPEGICVDPGGLVYVADHNDRVQKFDSQGNFKKMWGASGSGDGQLDWPHGMAADNHDNVWVADTYNWRMQRFKRDGTYKEKFYGSGTAGGGFKYPRELVVSPTDQIYVTDTSNHRVQKFQR